MSHVRAQLRACVRDALRAAFDAGELAVPSREAVAASRAFPADPPAVAVYALDEESGWESADPGAAPRLVRRLRLAVEAAAAADAGADDALDALCAQIERALAQDLTMGGRLALPAELAATEVELADDANPPLALATLTYLMEWRSDAARPEEAG